MPGTGFATRATASRRLDVVDPRNQVAAVDRRSQLSLDEEGHSGGVAAIRSTLDEGVEVRAQEPDQRGGLGLARLIGQGSHDRPGSTLRARPRRTSFRWVMVRSLLLVLRQVRYEFDQLQRARRVAPCAPGSGATR